MNPSHLQRSHGKSCPVFGGIKAAAHPKTCGQSFACRLAGLGLMLLFTSTALAAVPGRPLVNFNNGFDLKSLHCDDAKVAITTSGIDSALRINTGHKQPWPGVTVPNAVGNRDLSAYATVALRLKNTGTNAVTVYCRVDNPGADGTKHCVTTSLTLGPGQTNTLAAHRRYDDDDLVAFCAVFRDAFGDVLDAFGIADRRAAIFLNNQCHTKIFGVAPGNPLRSSV